MLNLLNPLWKYICALLSASSLILGLIVWYQSGQIHKWHTQNDKCAVAREADQDRYAAAQSKAAADNQAHVAQIEQKQKEISDDVEQRYQGDLARLRADNQRLQHNQSSAAPGSASGAGSSAPSQAPSGPDGETLSLPPAELLQGQECELQLNALIDWNNQQSAIDPNAGAVAK